MVETKTKKFLTLADRIRSFAVGEMVFVEGNPSSIRSTILREKGKYRTKYEANRPGGLWVMRVQ